MKLRLGLIVLVAVASSLVTTAAIELVRGEARPAVADIEAQPVAQETPPRGAEHLEAPAPSAAPLQAPDWTARLDDLERRIAALELRTEPGRTPVEATASAEGDELRELVLAWVAEEREARAHAQQIENEEAQLKDLEFGTRLNARVLAEEHELPEWQETRLADVFLEIELRRRELENDIDSRTDDPLEAERRFVEFDEWADQRLEEELGADLISEMFGDD